MDITATKFKGQMQQLYWIYHSKKMHHKQSVEQIQLFNS